MARGVPKAGFRAPRRSAAEKLSTVKVSYAAPVSNETDAEIEARLGERFEILDVLAEAHRGHVLFFDEEVSVVGHGSGPTERGG